MELNNKKILPIKKLGEVAEFVRGITYKKVDEALEVNTVGVLRANNISLVSHELDLTDIKYLRENLEFSDNQKLKKGDTFICIASGSPEHLGKVAYIHDDIGFYFGGFMGVVRSLDEEKLLPKYIYWNLVTGSFREHMDRHGKGVNINNLRSSDLLAYEIPLPPLSEQKKIVARIEEQFVKIDEAMRIREETIERTTALLPATVHEIFDVGRGTGWGEDELINLTASVADGTHDTPAYQDYGYPLITSKNLRPEGLTFEAAKFISENDYLEINKRSHVSQGDILVGMIGTIGNATQIETDKKFSIKNVGLIRPDETKVLGRYITYYLHNSRLPKLIKIGGTTQKFMALGTLRKIKIKHPSLEKQKAIVKRLDALSTKVRALQELQASQLEDFRALKQSILREAFST